MKLFRLGSFGLFVLAVMSAGAATAQSSDAPGLANATVLVIRHGEKPDSGTGLAPAGEARAKAYVKYFQTLKIGSATFKPDWMFASMDTKKSFRERLTLEPLGKAARVPVDCLFKNNQYQELANAMKNKPFGKNIIICWHHGNIPKLVQALGADSSKLIPGGKWPDEVFDWVLELRYDSKGHIIPSQTKRVKEDIKLNQ